MLRCSHGKQNMGYRIVITVTLAAVLTAVAIVALWPPPNLREPQCTPGERAFFIKDGWWCVQVRKP